MELIDKEKVVVEIEKMFKNYSKCGVCNSYELGLKEGRLRGYRDSLKKINNLDVKEVNLDEIAKHYLLHEHLSPLNDVLHQGDLKMEMQYHKDIENAYKAGVDFGLKLQKGE